MSLLKEAIRKNLHIFEKERSEGYYAWHVLFHAYKLSCIGASEKSQEPNQLLIKYYWLTLHSVLEQIPRKPIMGRKTRKTTARFRRIGKSHTYEPALLKDPYREDVKNAYLRYRQDVFIQLVTWMNKHAIPTILTYLKESEADDEEDRRRRNAQLNRPDAISVLSGEYLQ